MTSWSCEKDCQQEENMADMKCRYCGRKFDSINQCSSSPTKKHVALADGQNCVYCGRKFDNINRCPNSPSKKHMLDVG